MIITLSVVIMVLMAFIMMLRVRSVIAMIVAVVPRRHGLIDMSGVVLHHGWSGDDDHLVRVITVVAMTVVVPLMMVHIDHPVMGVAVSAHRNLYGDRGVDLNSFTTTEHCNRGQ